MNCKKVGHFARACLKDKPRTAQVKDLTAESSIPTEMFAALEATDIETKKINSLKAMRPIWVKTNDQNGPLLEIQCEVDTGAGGNVIPLKTYTDVFGAKHMDKQTMMIKGYSGANIKALGSTMMEIHLKEQFQLIRFQVTDTSGPPILGLQAATQLGYVSFPEIRKPTLNIRGHTAIHSVKNVLEVPAQKVIGVRRTEAVLLDSSTQLPSGRSETFSQVSKRAGDISPPLSQQLDVHRVPQCPRVTPNKVSRGSHEVPAPTTRPTRVSVPQTGGLRRVRSNNHTVHLTDAGSSANTAPVLQQRWATTAPKLLQRQGYDSEVPEDKR
jgi:hypothetical protein